MFHEKMAQDSREWELRGPPFDIVSTVQLLTTPIFLVIFNLLFLIIFSIVLSGEWIDLGIGKIAALPRLIVDLSVIEMMSSLFI
jgi:hypothetical protein